MKQRTAAALNPNSAVDRHQVRREALGWQGETTQWADAHKIKQRRQRAEAGCTRACPPARFSLNRSGKIRRTNWLTTWIKSSRRRFSPVTEEVRSS